MIEHRRAMIVAQAGILGYGAVYRSYQIGEQTLRRWRKRCDTDAAFREMVEAKRREFETAWVLDVRRRFEPVADDSPAGELLRAVVASLSAVVAHAALPPVCASVRPRQLAPTRHPDLMLLHGAYFSACFVLPWLGEGQEAREQRVLGRALLMIEDAAFVTREEAARLDYLERSRLLCRVPLAAVRPVVFSDYDPAPVFGSAFRRLGGASCNVLDVVRGRPLVCQNASTTEAATAAA
jgi:hypothetical protein